MQTIAEHVKGKPASRVHGGYMQVVQCAQTCVTDQAFRLVLENRNLGSQAQAIYSLQKVAHQLASGAAKAAMHHAV